MKIPAICDNCGNFFPSGYFVEGEFNFFSGNKAGPCPYCGGIGHIPDGLFSIVEDTIQVLSAPQRSFDELNRLVNILQTAQQNQTPTEEVEAVLENEFSFIKPILAYLKNTHIQAWFSILIAVISIVQSNSEPEPEKNIEINQVITNIYTTNDATLSTSRNILPVSSKVQAPKIEVNQPVTSNKVGRNTPCPCGSGEKYKRCHGK